MTFLQKIRYLFSRRDKKLFIAIGIVTFLMSLLEVLNLSLTMIFISSIMKFKTIAQTKYAGYLFRYTGPLTNQQIILFFGTVLIGFYLFRCVATLFYQYGIQKFFEKRRHALTFRLFNNYLHFNYQDFAAQNPATINKAIFIDSITLMTIISSIQMLFAEISTLILLYASLLVVNWKMTIILSFVLSLKVMTLLKIFSGKLAIEGNKMARHSRNISQLYNESYRNFKLVKLHGNEKNILSRFNKESKHLIQANIMRKVLQLTPRVFLETVGFTILVSAVMYIVYKIATPEYLIPILAMYALAFYRFMPSMTRIMEAYNQIVFSKNTIHISDEIMDQSEQFGEEQVSFGEKLSLKNISFYYKKDKNVLSDLSLEIKKQERIAFIGGSGAGKSTLADIIMGFYLPKTGKFFIDDQELTKENLRAWRKKIGYIPQQIYLFDGTVGENVAMGRKYDKEKVIKALKKANIYEFLLEKDGIETKVGEGGILLSGGQMQRVAIARALYSDPEILVLDEATSALDNETETKIMEEIYNCHKDKTLIIIAHRLTTVLRCEKIYKIENEKIELVDHDELIYSQLGTHDTKAQENVF